MPLYTVETHESHDLLTLEACNNQLQAETLYLQSLQSLQIGQTILLVQAPQNILKTHTKRA